MTHDAGLPGGSIVRRLPVTFFLLFFSHFYFPAFGQAVVTGVVPSPPRFLPSVFIAHRVQQSHCSSIFHRELLTHALALSASQFVHKKKSQRFYTSMQSEGLDLTKLTYTRLEDNLIRHRGDRLQTPNNIKHLLCTTTENKQHAAICSIRASCPSHPSLPAGLVSVKAIKQSTK